MYIYINLPIENLEKKYPLNIKCHFINPVVQNRKGNEKAI